MRRFFTLVPLLAGCVVAGAADQPAPPALDPAKMQAAMEQMTKTGAEHEALKRCVGEWDVVVTMTDVPGQPPETSKGRCSAKEILGGKWVREDFHGEAMGQPFEGLGLNGFDTTVKKYRSFWFDSMGTMPTDMTGTSDDGGKTITYASDMENCPMTGQPIHQRWVVAFDGADKRTLTCFSTPKGMPEYQSMQIVYTRAK